MSDTQALLQHIHPIVEEILQAFDVDQPPIPVELMLQRPRNNMWPEVDLSEMSATFLSLDDRFAPRMSAVRLLARNIVRNTWGQERDLGSLLEVSGGVNLFARAIILPKNLLDNLSDEALQVHELSKHFEVPEADVQSRLQDLGYV